MRDRQLTWNAQNQLTGQNVGTGLYSMGERYYNPSTGTFISQDPTGFSSGTDLYQYTNDDPVDFNDPTGCGAERENCVAVGTFLIALLVVALGFLLFGPGVGLIAEFEFGDVLGVARSSAGA